MKKSLNKDFLFICIIIIILLLGAIAIYVIDYNSDKNQYSYGNNTSTTTKNKPVDVKTTTTRTAVNATLERVNSNKDYSKYPTQIQYPDYPTGCETVSLYLLLKYYKISVTIDEILNRLNKKDIYQKNAQGETCVTNPNEAFLGDPKRNVNSRGVFNDPIKDVAEQYKKGAISRSDMPFTELESIVKSGRPAVVWTTLNMRAPSAQYLGVDCKTGENIIWQTNEHAVLLIDVVDDAVVVSDPTTGTIKYYDKGVFIDRYTTMGSRAVYY